MFVASQITRCFSTTTTPSSSPSSSYRSSSSSSSSSSLTSRQCVRLTCRARAGVQEQQIPPPPPPSSTVQLNNDRTAASVSDSSGSGIIEVPRQRYISVPKSKLLDAIVSTMFPSPEDSRQFRSLSECLDAILHAEHKSMLEELRADFDQTLPKNSDGASLDDFSPFERYPWANQKGSGAVMDDEADIEMPQASDFGLDLRLLLDSSLRTLRGNPSKGPRFMIPVRFQRAFMKLLNNAEFEELTPRDLMLSSALNTDYLLTLPIYVDWKRASESGAILFRRGYATERQKGLLIAEKLDYLQSKLLQNLFSVFAQPLGRFAVWLNEVLKNISHNKDTEVWANKFSHWLKELSLSLQPQTRDEQISDDLQGNDILSTDLPIWVAAQKAVTRYEGILSSIGPRERLLRKFLTSIGILPSTPQQASTLDTNSSGSASYLSPRFLSRISLSDIWKPASPKSCGNDFQKMLGTAVSILFSRSVLQEPAFQELILLYTEEGAEREIADKSEVSSLQMKIYEKIPIPDLPVVFPHKKLSFRIIDTVRLDVATILGLLAFFLSYKFEDILSSPSAVLLDVIAASALVIYVSRVLLGYKQTRDRYQLLVNRTLYEKTIASGFGSIHFLLDASEQQLYKEAILVYATLLQVGSGQVCSRRAIGDKCERFLYDTFEEKIEMPVDKAIETLTRLGLVVDKVVDGQFVVQAISCNQAYIILRNRWNSLIS